MNHLSIEELENDVWQEPDFDSYVVKTSCAARKKPLSELSQEEIRLLLGQRIGLKYIIPIGISILEKNPVIMVRYYEGDLLQQFLCLKREDWEENRQDLQRLKELVKKSRKQISLLEEISLSEVEKFLQIV